MAQNTPAAETGGIRTGPTSHLGVMIRFYSSAGDPLLTDVAGHKGDHQLLGFAALGTGLGNGVLV